MRPVWTDVHVPCQKDPKLFSAPEPKRLWSDLTAPETAQERRERERAAVQLCWQCPVWRQCREWALGAVDQVSTVCGGLTPAQLRNERKRRAA